MLLQLSTERPLEIDPSQFVRVLDHVPKAEELELVDGEPLAYVVEAFLAGAVAAERAVDGGRCVENCVCVGELNETNQNDTLV